MVKGDASSSSGRVSPEELPSYNDSVPTPPSPTGPEPAQQYAIYEYLKDNEMESGDLWALIDRNWFKRWTAICTGQGLSKEDEASGLNQVGPIDNRTFADVTGKFTKFVQAGVDVEVIPLAAWDRFVEWYGNAGPVVTRQVVAVEGSYKSERVEFYPPEFTLLRLLPSTNESVQVPIGQPAPKVTLYSDSKVSNLKLAASSRLQLSRPIRLWRLGGGADVVDPTAAATAAAPEQEEESYLMADQLKAQAAELIEKGDVTESSTLTEALLSEPAIRVAVEEQAENGSWLVDDTHIVAMPATRRRESTNGVDPDAGQPSAAKKTLFSNPGGFFRAMEQTNKSTTLGKDKAKETEDKKTPASGGGGLFGALTTRSMSRGRTGRQGGLTGLQNLGNTCFMNSALQCMSNTKELKEYFLSGVYKDELNRDNPLGMGGQIALNFGDLLEKLWASSGSSVAPRDFKYALSRFAPQFSGYGQQDTQELLAFLLDGVHEDLNRIKKKPATSSPDWEGGGDKELIEMAKTCWEQYRSRNDSVIVDLFQGQYRSTVVCPDCDKVSITFDPFMYVTVGLPIVKKWQGKVYYVPMDPAKPRYTITVEMPKNATFKQLKNAVGNFMNTDPRKLLLAEEYSSKWFRPWYDDEQVSEASTSNDTLVFYESGVTFPQLARHRYAKTQDAMPEPAEDPDEPSILLPVFNTAKFEKAHRSFTTSHREVELFGSPFVVTLTPRQASTVSGIYKAIATQYSRVTTHGAEILESLEDVREPDDAAPPAPAPPVSAPPLPVVDSAPAPVAPPTPPPEVDAVEPVVTAPEVAAAAPEIDPALLSQDTAMDVEAPAEPEASAAEPAKPDTDVTADDVEEAVPAPVYTEPFKGIFSISVTANPRSTLPFHQTQWNEGSMAPLETRANRLRLSQPVEEGKIVPLVRTGDHVHCLWPTAAFTHYFGEKNATWTEMEDFVDPAIEEARARAKGPKKSITIHDCLTEFTKEERLGEDDTWYCPDCKKHQQATKTVEIWKAPDVLVFALKRFSSSRHSRDKVDDFVDFPLKDFDLAPFIKGDMVEARVAEAEGRTDFEAESLVYDLYAVDNHYGGLGGGHYTAYAMNPDNGKWYDFDDSRVSEISDPDRVRTKAAYLLFYRRRTTRPIGGEKSLKLVESAIQSRAASVASSAHGSNAGSRPESRGRSPAADDEMDTTDPFNATPRQGGFISIDRGAASDTEVEGPDSPRDHSDDDDVPGYPRHPFYAPRPPSWGLAQPHLDGPFGSMSSGRGTPDSGTNWLIGPPMASQDELPFGDEVHDITLDDSGRSSPKDEPITEYQSAPTSGQEP